MGDSVFSPYDYPQFLNVFLRIIIPRALNFKFKLVEFERTIHVHIVYKKYAVRKVVLKVRLVFNPI